MAFEIKQYEDIVNDIVQRLLLANPNLTDLNESSIMRMLIETYSLELESEEFSGVYQKIRDVYEATRVSTATGDDLEEIGKLVGVTRKEGDKAICVVTMTRVTPSFVDFTIPLGSIVSTQPDGSSNQFRYVSVADTVYYGTIIDEEHTFINGIYDYKLDQRFYSEISGVIAKFGGVDTPMVKDTNFEEVLNYTGKLVDTETIIVVDTCETVTGWAGSTDADAPTNDLVNKRQGTASIGCGKTGTSEPFFYYDKTYSVGFDLTAKTPNLKIRIANQAEYDAIDKLVIQIGDSAIDYLIFEIPKSELQVGWTSLFLDTTTAQAVGAPQIGDIKYVKVQFDTISAASVIASGNVNIDFIIFGDVIDYTGDILRIIDDGTLPDSSTFLKTTYVPLSVEVNTIAEEIGTDYNAGPGKVTFKVSSLPNIVNVYNYNSASYGEDIETDDSLRTRITQSTSGLGKATVEAIETEVAQLDFVDSVNVVDMPPKLFSESFVFATGTSEYQLSYEVVQQNTILNAVVDKNTLANNISGVQTTIEVANGGAYSNSGHIRIENEIISYNGISGNDLENCVRGAEGSTNDAHSFGTEAKQWFKPATDYDINEESKVVWTGLANEPLDTEVVYIDYQYRWLGHIQVFVSGPFTFTVAQNDSIDEAIMDVKAAGIAYTFTTPTVVNTNVSANVKVKPGYSFGNVQALANALLEQKLNSYVINENVYQSQLIDVIQSIEGVDYVELIVPAATVVIGPSEIAKSGTIIVSEI